MIKNERQYRITKAQASEFAVSLDQFAQEERPTDVHPLVWKAQGEAMRSQLDELTEELQNYEALKKVPPVVIHATGLQDLPAALIRARIALDMSHKQLAERMNLKEQQVQRYEATNYSSATLTRLADVAAALGVRVSEQVFLPQTRPTRNYLFERLEEVGITTEFVINKLLPTADAQLLLEADESQSTVAASRAADTISHVFGWEPGALFGTRELTFSKGAMATARFKVTAGPQAKRLNAYIAYAHHLAMVIANASSYLPKRALELDWQAYRTQLLHGRSNLDLRTVIENLWDQGVPVLPLEDEGVFHGASWRVAGRNVIVVKQRTRFASRWVFDLLHEAFHAGQNPEDPDHSWIEDDDIASGRRTSPEEQAANRFAADVLLRGQAESLVAMCVKEAKGNVSWLKGAVGTIAKMQDVRVADLANYLAFRLSLQKINWWGTATNLQEASDPDPFEVARDVFMERFDFSRIDSLSSKLLQRAMFAEGDLHE